MSRAHLGKLMEELDSDIGYATGRRSFPRTVTVDDAVEIVTALHEQIDIGTGARAKAAAGAGMKIACGIGCAACCEEPIMIYLPEAHLIARWLARPENAPAREKFAAAYQRWRAAAGDWPDKLAEDYPDAEKFRAGHEAGWRLRNPCAFLDEQGACTIYAVRPTVCRNAHAVDDAARCRGDTLVPASRLSFKPVDDFVERTRRVVRAAHHAIGGRKSRPAAMCVVVYEMLER